MKKESMRKYSLLGLVLIGASAVTAAVLPKSEPKKFVVGLVASAGASNDQQTCTVNAPVGAACTATEGSNTTSGGVTSLVATNVRTATVAGGVATAHLNSSQSPN